MDMFSQGKFWKSKTGNLENLSWISTGSNHQLVEAHLHLRIITDADAEKGDDRW